MPPHRTFLRVLGVPELRSAAGEPIKFRTKKHFALLCFLATEPRTPHRRDRLTELLWPEAPHSEGRHSLATALSVLRAKLGPRAFETTRDTVRLVAAGLEVDLDRLQRGEVLGDDVPPPLDVGGFLDDLEVSRAPEYMFWRDRTRSHLFPAIRTALVQLMDRCRRSGDFTRIEGHSDRLLALDELNEDAIRAKMEARAFAGDRLTALRIFQAWKQRMAEDLGAAPSPLVEGMALRLRQRGYEAPGTAHIPTVPTDQWRGRAFVGRGAQYRELYARWESTQNRHGRHVLLLGESGIGKTTLAERLVTAAGLEGAVSSRVQCYDVERDVPYSAIGTLVRGLIDRPGASATDPEWLAELARVVPAVASRFPTLHARQDASGEQTRLRLMEAVAQLAASVADEQPVILVVDDVHHADHASVAILNRIMRGIEGSRIMAILMGRGEELEKSLCAGRLLEQQDAIGLTIVDLPPLSEEEMSELVVALAEAKGTAIPPAIRQALIRASNGVPMLAELLCDDWHARADECLALSVGAMTTIAATLDGREVYERVFDRMVGDLSGATRSVLNLAAILGDRLGDFALYQLIDITLAQALGAMAELANRRILRDGGREMEFRNELLRNYVYMKVPAPLRRTLHSLIADHLIRTDFAGQAISGLTLAWHCVRAGRDKEATPFLLRGAREAIERGDPYAAEFALRTGMHLIGATEQVNANLILCESMLEQGRWTDALHILESIDPPEGPLAQRRFALIRNAEAGVTLASDRAAVSLEAIEAALADGVEPSVATPLIRAADVFIYNQNDALRARRLLPIALRYLEEATGFQDSISLVSSTACIAWVARRRDILNDLLMKSVQLQARAVQTGVRNRGAARLAVIEGAIRSGAGDYAGAQRAYLRACEDHHRRADLGSRGGAAASVALCMGRQGNPVGQIRWATIAVDLHKERAQDTPQYLTHSLLLLAEGHARCLQNKDAVATLQKIETHLTREPRPWAQQSGALRLADIHLLMGDKRHAMALAEQALEEHGAIALSSAFAGPVARWIALVSGQRGWISEGRLALERFIAELPNHDAIDQAEIVAAARKLSRDQQEHDWLTAQLAKLLTALPEDAENHLRRCGVLG